MSTWTECSEEWQVVEPDEGGEHEVESEAYLSAHSNPPQTHTAQQTPSPTQTQTETKSATSQSKNTLYSAADIINIKMEKQAAFLVRLFLFKFTKFFDITFDFRANFIDIKTIH